MNSEEFRRHGHDVIDWIADYLDNADRYPVMSRSKPGEIKALIPDSAPENGEPMETILEDFRRDILPGVTHWNHPRFFAYFPANNSAPSILGEMLSASGFHGVIQDTASTATMGALVCAREKATAFAVNAAGPAGLAGAGPLRIYASREAHSSVLKGAKIAGFGAENVVQVEIDENRAMDPADLEAKITTDLADGLIPCCVVATVGTTGCTAIDPLATIGPVAKKHGLWLHVDAALAGSAAILPEMRWILDGVEHADSLVFNPHKWLLTNFDCSAYFVRDPEHLERTMSIHPEYLKTGRDREVNNYMDWGIPLGRRFRALKLWFVLRSYGAVRLREIIAGHIAFANEFAGWIDAAGDWERLAPVPVNTVCFRWNPGGMDEEALNVANAALVDRVNADGTIYLTHTKLDDIFTIRLAVGQRATEREHVVTAWETLQEIAGC